MTKIADLIQVIENFAPPLFQESYDNVGLLVGDRTKTVEGVLITLDCTPEIVDEAIENKCNLIVAHHPIIFGGIKKLTGANYIERTIIKAIKHDIAIYAAHTNLDNVQMGVNKKISDIIGLKNTKVLVPKNQLLYKIEIYVPATHADKVRNALNNAGAGNIGNYKNCSFTSNGIGFFEPQENANPFLGKNGNLESVEETKLELIYPKNLHGNVLQAMRNSHPYEEIAYNIFMLENKFQEIGSGMIGTLDQELSQTEFLEHLKNVFQLKVIKFTPISHKIKKIGVCGGSGSFLLKSAIAQKADAFVSADFKYHEYFDAEGKILIADIGHYESEVCTKEIFSEIIKKNFTNIAISFSKTTTNPIQYYI